MLTQSSHIRTAATGRFLLLGIWLIAQCCLMASPVLAENGLAHDHPTSPGLHHTASSWQTAPVADACCSAIPTLTSSGVSLLKAPVSTLAAERSEGITLLVALREPPSHAPPPKPGTRRSHVLLQIYLI